MEERKNSSVDSLFLNKNKAPFNAEQKAEGARRAMIFQLKQKGF